jgi:hypothetical protein
MNTLPTERDLPAHRHAAIRAEIDRVTAHASTGTGTGTAPAWRRRRLLVPVAAAAAAGTVLAASVAVLSDRPDEVTPASAPGPASTPGADPDRGNRLGLTDQQAREITQGCLWITGLGRPDGTEPVSTTGPPVQDVRLANLLDDGAGRLAVLYGSHVVLDCTVGGPTLPYDSGFAGLREPRPAGPLTVDLTGGAAGGDLPGNKASHRGLPGTEHVIGRVGDGVARVTVTVGGRTAVATVANGTFVARFVHASTWAPPAAPEPTSVRAYDAAGTLLAEVDPYAAAPR